MRSFYASIDFLVNLFSVVELPEQRFFFILQDHLLEVLKTSKTRACRMIQHELVVGLEIVILGVSIGHFVYVETETWKVFVERTGNTCTQLVEGRLAAWHDFPQVE